jgi:hypothetical protein
MDSIQYQDKSLTLSEKNLHDYLLRVKVQEKT